MDDLLIKDIMTCPWCSGKGSLHPDAAIENKMYAYMCEDCCAVWFINKPLDYLLFSHHILNKTEW